MDLLENVHLLRSLLILEPNPIPNASQLYTTVRATLLADALTHDLIVDLIGGHATLGEYLRHLKKEFQSPRARQEFLEGVFASIHAKLEPSIRPCEAQISATLENFDHKNVVHYWQKALERCRSGDFDGAITSARTLLEATCKSILTELKIEVAKNSTLPELYRLATRHLLHTQTADEDTKKIVASCMTIVSTLSALRNKLSDAHAGTGIRPDRKHADLVVRLAGTISAFLASVHDQNAKGATAGTNAALELKSEAAVAGMQTVPPFLGSANQQGPVYADAATTDPSGVLREVFVSYSRTPDSEAVVSKLAEAIRFTNATLLRDTEHIGYRDSILDFMRRLGRGKYVVVVLSKHYLQSKYCMFELIQVANAGDIDSRVFPIVLPDSNIYDAIGRLDYTHYWEGQTSQLNAKIKMGDGQNLKSVHEELDLFAQIRTMIDSLVGKLSEMNARTLSHHLESGFKDVLDAITQD